MATYAIGDVQGCWWSLGRLLERVNFVPGKDRLWLTGDLVNRGPDSLAVLRFLMKLGNDAVCILGNHDLHLLARAHGLAPAKARDTLDEVLTATDRDALIEWLATRPLLHQERNVVMVHAGLMPDWSIAAATAEAQRLSGLLAHRDSRIKLLSSVPPDASLTALTTLRTAQMDGAPVKFSGAPSEAPAGAIPWYAHPRRKSRGTMVVFGHWAALGPALGADYACIDTGCVWGRELTALRLDDWRTYSVPAAERAKRRD